MNFIFFDERRFFFRLGKAVEFFDGHCSYRANAFYFFQFRFFRLKNIFRGFKMLYQYFGLHATNMRNKCQSKLVWKIGLHSRDKVHSNIKEKDEYTKGK